VRPPRFTETELPCAVKEQDCLPARPVWSSGNCALEGLFCTPYGTTLELPVGLSSPTSGAGSTTADPGIECGPVFGRQDRGNGFEPLTLEPLGPIMERA